MSLRKREPNGRYAPEKPTLTFEQARAIALEDISVEQDAEAVYEEAYRVLKEAVAPLCKTPCPDTEDKDESDLRVWLMEGCFVGTYWNYQEWKGQPISTDSAQFTPEFIAHIWDHIDWEGAYDPDYQPNTSRRAYLDRRADAAINEARPLLDRHNTELPRLIGNIATWGRDGYFVDNYEDAIVALEDAVLKARQELHSFP